jgi:hypothetical protein
MNRLLALVPVILLHCGLAFAGESTLESDFNAKYLAWVEVRSEMGYMSDTFGWADTPAFRAIVDLGPAALPLIAGKVENDPRADFLLQAIQIITKVKITEVFDHAQYRMVCPDYPELEPSQDPYWYWWNEGRFKTGERFSELYGKWRALREEKKDKEAQETYQKIIDLGLPVLPYLVDKAAEQPELVPAVSTLSDGALPPTATAADCREWWEKNKQKFELPPRSQPDEGSGKK